jgi:Cobalamin biosynthesis protein CobT VWA domain
VIHDIERLGEVELTAIGIGHDVTRYHRRAITIVDAEQLAGFTLERLAELFDEDRGSNTRVRSRRLFCWHDRSVPSTGRALTRLATLSTLSRSAGEGYGRE